MCYPHAKTKTPEALLHTLTKEPLPTSYQAVELEGLCSRRVLCQALIHQANTVLARAGSRECRTTRCVSVCACVCLCVFLFVQGLLGLW